MKENAIISGESNKRIGFLDSVRGIAILLVFLLHATDGWLISQAPKNEIHSLFYQKIEWAIHFLISFGQMGVAVFFVVSGFCIHLSFNKTQNYKIFYIKRFFRIYPPYLVALLFFSFFFPCCNLDWVNSESHIKVFLQHLFLINNYREFGTIVLNPNFWSIATEVQLYLLYPLVLLATKRFGWKFTMSMVFAVEFSLRLTQLIKGGYIYGLNISPFMFLFSWSIGACICEDFLNNQKSFFASQSLLMWIGVCFLARFFNVLNNFEFPFAACATATYIAKSLDHKVESMSPSFVNKIIKRIGIYSYGIYLLHHPFLWLAYRFQFSTTPRINARLEHYFSFSFDPKIHIICYFMLVGVMIFYISMAFYKLVEIPSISLGNVFIKESKRFN